MSINMYERLGGGGGVTPVWNGGREGGGVTPVWNVGRGGGGK